MLVILYAREKGKIIVLSQISPMSDLCVWGFGCPTCSISLHPHLPGSPGWMFCVHRAPHSQHKIWICISSPYNTSQNNHWQCKCSHIFFCLYVVNNFFFWTIARRLFPWWKFLWMIQKASFLTQLSQICSVTLACLDPRRKPQTQVRSVWPLQIREGLVWASDTSQGAHMRGIGRFWMRKAVFCHFCNHLVQNEAHGSSPGLKNCSEMSSPPQILSA